MLIVLSIGSFAQPKTITLKTGKKPLSDVLEQVGKQQSVRFAFDAGYFAQITTDLTLTNCTLADFVKLICEKHHLLAEEIDQTIVLYRNPAPIPEALPEMVRLTGVVRDAGSNEPLLFCNLLLSGENARGTTTNELGIFNIQQEKQDKITLSISHLGYQRLDTVIDLLGNRHLNIRLKPFAINIEVIQVFQQEKNVIEMGNRDERIAFNPKQSANLPRIDDSDLISSLSLIPGISFTGGQTQGIAIRGSSPAENLITLDGIPILETAHLFGNLSVLNSKYTTQAFVSRGAFDATYGEKVSGIVELKGKSNYRMPSLDLTANLLNVSATANIPIGKIVSVSGAYRRSYIDRWENYLYRQILKQNSTADESTVSPDIQFDDLNLKLAVKPSDNHEINVNLMNSYDLQVRDYVFAEGSRLFRYEDADSKNRGVSANWFGQFSPSFQQRITVGYNDLTRSGYSRSGMNPNSQGKGGKTEREQTSNAVKEYTAQWASELKTGPFAHQLGFGANLDQVAYNFVASRSTGTQVADSIVFDSKSVIYHAYVQEKVKLTEKLEARLGLRMNYTDLTSKSYFQPRWGLKYKLGDGIDLMYAGGLYCQFMTRIRKIDINENSDLVWYLPDQSGNGILKTWQQIAGIQFEKNGWAANAEAYLKTTTGRVNLYAEQTGGQEKTVIYNQHQGKSTNYGIDLMLLYKHSKFTHIVSGTLSRSDEQFDSFNEGATYPSFDDQRVKLRWTEIASIHNWVFSSSLYYHTGSPYLSASVNSGNQFARLPYFLQADFSVIKRVNVKFVHLSTGISLLNFTNRQNVLEVDYFNVSDATGTYAVRTDITAVRFTPVFFLNILFQ